MPTLSNTNASPLSISDYKLQLSQNPAWATRAIVVLYSYQTGDEQRAQTTAHSNGVGFNGTDAYILSSFAQQIQRGYTLSPKQLAIAYKKLPKYATQLKRIADSK